MYLDYLVDIPEVKDKITFRSKGNARYVYYEYDRIYDPSKKYTTETSAPIFTNEIRAIVKIYDCFCERFRLLNKEKWCYFINVT